jgi:hypothetical protein
LTNVTLRRERTLASKGDAPSFEGRFSGHLRMTLGKASK